MATASESNTDDRIDVQAGEGPDEEPEAPDSAEECRVSLDVIEVDGQELAELFAHGEPPADSGGPEPRKVSAPK